MVWLKNHIDSTFLISNNFSLTNGDDDQIGYEVYDVNGNALKVKLDEIFGYCKVVEYGLYNLEERRTVFKDYIADSRSYTHFDSNNMNLVQIWNGNPTDTFIYRFDKAGYLKSFEHYFDSQYYSDNHNETQYIYSTDHKIIEIVHENYITDQELEVTETEFNCISTSHRTNYFYSDNIDSIISTYNFRSGCQPQYKEKIYFDDRGLITHKVKMDSIITRYIHKKRDFE
jgi:hypothetical protein